MDSVLSFISDTLKYHTLYGFSDITKHYSGTSMVAVFSDTT